MKMTQYKISTFIFIIFALLISSTLFAKLRDFETTRLKSTAGTGVGSILMDEASVLNPASVAFFENASIYLQKSSGNITNENNYSSPNVPMENNNMAVIISESGQKLSGSISYQVSENKYDKRKRIALATANRLNDRTALGISARMTTDEISNNGKDIATYKTKQFSFGTTHILSNSVTMGVVFIDPFKDIPEETKALLGFQYVYQNFISLMADAGADYNNDLADTFLYRGAIQFKVFKNFYLRAGFFNDKAKFEDGTGVGISWVQPKLMLDFAIKNTNIGEDLANNTEAEKIKETSFSLSYRF